VTVGKWQPLFQGVELATGEADQAEVRRQRVLAVRIDVQAPGVEFFSTPANGDRPLETISETTAEFLVHHGVQVAINANFFSPCCSPGDKDLSGLAISRGEVVSPPEVNRTNSQALVITRDNRARIVDTAAAEGFSSAGIWTAVSGSDRLLLDGKKPANWAEARAKAVHPRTAVGVSRYGRFVLWLVVDGRQAGYSEGANFAELADWLQRFGAHAALQ
jgi:exopolysaccharide biosynthesis protein